MANEIVEITREPMRDGLTRFRVVYLYNLADYGGPILIERTDTKVIPQSRADLAPQDGEIVKYGLVPEPWLEAIDNGDAYYIEDLIEQEAGDTLPQTLQKVKARYTKGTSRIAQERARWLNAGKQYTP